MFNNVKRLSDEQLTQVLQQARSGNNDTLQAMGLYSPIPLMAEQLRRKNLREETAAQQQQAQGQQPSVIDQLAGVGSLPVPGMMEEQNYANGGIVAFAKGGSGEEIPYEEFDRRTVMAESRGNPNAIGPMTRYGTAKGDRQVLDMTNRDPGFGVTPARNDSLEERSRVGKDYLQAMTDRYKYLPYASLAYNWGPGYVDKWIKRGANPSEIPPESRAYVIKTTGVDLAKLGPGATTKFSGTGTKKADEPISQPPSSEGIQANYTAGRKEALDKMEALRKEREGLLEKPEAPDTEAERKQMLEERANFRRPFEERMDAMIAGAKPDPNSDLLKASLALMTGRGKGISGALADIGAAGGIGVDAFEKSRSAYQRAQQLGEQEKFKLAKGDYDAANDAATQKSRLFRTAMTEYNKGREAIAKDHATNLRAVDQDFDARWKMFYEDARLKRMEDKDARRYADQSALNERQTKAIEERNRRSALDAVSRAMKAAQSSDNIERFASEASQTPEYKRLREAKDRAGKERYVREFAQQKALESALASEGISLAEYQEIRRGQAGLGSIPRSAPAQAAPAQSSAAFNMDASGRISPAR